MGKALAGAIPSLVATWVTSALFLVAMALMGWGNLISMVMTPVWFISLLVLTPAVVILSFLLGVASSSSAKDAKSARTISLLVIAPLFAVIAVQVTGVVWFTTISALALALAICLIDYWLLRVAVRLFQRETILVRWR